MIITRNANDAFVVYSGRLWWILVCESRRNVLFQLWWLSAALIFNSFNSSNNNFWVTVPVWLLCAAIVPSGSGEITNIVHTAAWFNIFNEILCHILRNYNNWTRWLFSCKILEKRVCSAEKWNKVCVKIHQKPISVVRGQDLCIINWDELHGFGCLLLKTLQIRDMNVKVCKCALRHALLLSGAAPKRRCAFFARRLA